MIYSITLGFDEEKVTHYFQGKELDELELARMLSYLVKRKSGLFQDVSYDDVKELLICKGLTPVQSDRNIRVECHLDCYEVKVTDSTGSNIATISVDTSKS